jgi:hypothetical protein
MMRRTPLSAALAVAVVLAVAAVAAACGGSSTAAGSPSPAASSPAPVVPHDTSSPAQALVGHWHDANDMQQYFNGKVWSTVTAGGEHWQYGYQVLEQNQADRSVLLKTFDIVASGATDQNVENIRFTFVDDTWKQLQWGKAGTTAQYVDGKTAP